MRKLVLIYLVFLLIFPACAVLNKETVSTAKNTVSEKPADTIKMLTAGDFPELSKDIAEYLQQRGCRIPQIWDANNDPRLRNVTSGSFYDKGGRDWAILCSENGSSTILIFRNGSVKAVDELAKTTDQDYLQGVDATGTYGFSRLIAAIDKNYIKKRDEEFNKNGIAKSLPDGIDGIEDIYVEKASVIHYFRNGKWIELHGSD